ncbi:hypothetical protein FOZ62_018180, partial [Perkinsus olseni]
MSTKHLITVASTAVALVSNLPLGNAISSVSPDDDFIPLVNRLLSTEDYRIICMHERGDKNTTGWESLNVHVSKGLGVRTRYIACPKTDEWSAFRIEFPKAKPGDTSRPDPLRKLNKSTFGGILDAVDPYVRGKHGGMGPYANFEFVVLTGSPLCSLVREAMKNQY